jgi:methylmalonyl-CoA/ethylmalonyl-CoA epimerase
VNLLRIDHTGIAVRDMDEALARYKRIYGLEPSERVTVVDQHVEVAFLPVSDTRVELVQPTDMESGVARFLQKHGEGLHHIAFLVEDIHRELKRLRDEGVELIDREPREGPHGLIAFVHPRGNGGILVELVEHSADQFLQA